MTAVASKGCAVDSVGYYIMIALLGAGAAYGLANKGKPRPGVSSAQKKILIACGAVLGVCVVLLVAVVLISQSAAQH
jgi:hypothetical protein